MLSPTMKTGKKGEKTLTGIETIQTTILAAGSAAGEPAEMAFSVAKTRKGSCNTRVHIQLYCFAPTQNRIYQRSDKYVVIVVLRSYSFQSWSSDTSILEHTPLPHPATSYTRLCGKRNSYLAGRRAAEKQVKRLSCCILV